MTTAKIKEVKQVKPYDGQNGTVYYHNLVMDNGEKINIGKKKEQQPGYQLTYEIIGDKKEDGTYQQEFPKAKAVQAQSFPKANYSGSKGSQSSFSLAYAKDLAVAHIEQGREFKTSQILEVATAFNNWLKEN